MHISLYSASATTVAFIINSLASPAAKFVTSHVTTDCFLSFLVTVQLSPLSVVPLSPVFPSTVFNVNLNGISSVTVFEIGSLPAFVNVIL